MLFRLGQGWIVDVFVRRGWVVKRRRLRHRETFSNPMRTVAAQYLSAAERLEDRTLLSTITVTSLADSLNAGSGVTLRDAIQAANTDTSVDGSVAGEAGVQNVITFQAGLNGTISLNSALGAMTLSSSMTIQGLGAANTIIDAQHGTQIFNIPTGSTNVALSGLTLENGKTTANNAPGGAIASVSTGTLVISNAVLTGNSTTGTSSFGGAIYADQGPVTITNSILSGNSTQGSSSSGGAIQMGFGDLTISNSTLSGNFTQAGLAQGGAIHTKFGRSR